MFSRIACCSHIVAKNHSAQISRKSKTLQASSEHKMRHIESHLKEEGISVSRIAIARSPVGSGGKREDSREVKVELVRTTLLEFFLNECH